MQKKANAIRIETYRVFYRQWGGVTQTSGQTSAEEEQNRNTASVIHPPQTFKGYKI